MVIGFDSAGDAEDAIAKLAAGCRDFELELNADKTRTLDSASTLDAVWATELREYRFKRNVAGQSRSLEHYFAKAFEFALQHADQNVLDYAIKRTKGIVVVKENWRGYETFLLKAARANATVIPTVVQILVSYNFEGYSLGLPRVTKLVEDLIKQNSPTAHHAEVAWSLFAAKALKLTISKAAVEAVESLESSVCALIALDLEHNGLLGAPIDKTLWQQSMTSAGLRSSLWLLAYEADLKGWLAGPVPNFVSNDPYFSVLKSKGVSFYDVKKNVTHIKKEKPKPPSPAFLNFLQVIDAEDVLAPPLFDLSMADLY